MASYSRFTSRLVVLAAACFIIFLCVTCYVLRQTEQALVNTHSDSLYGDDHGKAVSASKSHRLAVIIPFRERFTELQSLLPHLSGFLSKQHVAHSFYVINQVDNYRFNRGALLNVGVVESAAIEKNCTSPKSASTQLCLPATDYLAFHDVDLLPIDPALDYSYPLNGGPMHLIPPELHPRYYWYKPYFGGVVLLSRTSFASVNGFSNSFWGWGREDDEFRLRILWANFTISTPKGVTSGTHAFRIIHNEEAHPRDLTLYQRPDIKQLFSTLKGGLNDLNYTVASRRRLTIDGVSALVINVRLTCNASPIICKAKTENTTTNRK